MKPHSLSTLSLVDSRSKVDKFKALGPFAERWGNVVKGTVLPETLAVACPRVKVADLPEGHLKQRHLEHLEHNQKLAHCCRHPENHEVEACKSHPDEPAPDIYIYHCSCGRKHRFLCGGRTDTRPVWDAS